MSPGDLLSEDEADELVTDMLAEMGAPEPEMHIRVLMRGALMMLVRNLLARGWRIEAPRA